MEDNMIIDLYWARDQRAVAESEDKYGAYCRSIAQGILDRREEHNEWGDYLYLKYLMPDRKGEKKGARPPRRKADNRTALASCSGLKHSVSSGKPRRKGG